MSKLQGWRAYYPDKTIDSSETTPSKLPDGVALIVEFWDKPYRELVYGGDYYVWNNGWSHTGTGEWGEWVIDEPKGTSVKSCSRLPEEEFEVILNKAMEDRQWP